MLILYFAPLLKQKLRIFPLSVTYNSLFRSSVWVLIWDHASQFRAVAMLLLIVWNYKVRCWMFLRWNNIFTNFRENWSTYSEVETGEVQTAW